MLASLPFRPRHLVAAAVLLLACDSDDSTPAASTTSGSGGSEGSTTDPETTSSPTATSSDPTEASETSSPGESTDGAGTSGDPSTSSGGSGCELATDCPGNATCVGGECTEPSPTTIYLHGSGITLALGDQEDATLDTVMVSEQAGTWPAIDDDRIASLVPLVGPVFAPFDITVTSSRPTRGPYTMVVITPSPHPVQFGAASFTVLDCGNANPNGVGVVYDDPMLDLSTQQLANIVANAAGVSYGVPRVDNPADAMHAFFSEDAQTFVDDCSPLDGKTCTPQAAGCAGGESNSSAELAANTSSP